MALKPRRGDRNIRNEDKYLFLETLISAREKLYISFVGQDITTGKEYNPSVVVSELLEYIEKNYGAGDKSILEYIFTEHKLQSYNPEYFLGKDKFFSYSTLRQKEALSFLDKNQGYEFFKELPDITEDEKNITADDLVEFLANPAKYVLKKRLGINLELKIQEIKDEEDFFPDKLTEYKLKSTILNLRQREKFNKEEIFSLLKAKGELPHGALGKSFYEEYYIETEKLLAKLDLAETIEATEGEIYLPINDINISAKYTLYGTKQIFYRIANLKQKDKLRGWIYHLLLCSQRSGITTYVIANDKDKKDILFQEITKDYSLEIIRELIKIYKAGMKHPVPLFPN